MSIFILITLIALVTVFSVDVRQKRRDFLQQKSAQKNDF